MLTIGSVLQLTLTMMPYMLASAQTEMIIAMLTNEMLFGLDFCLMNRAALPTCISFTSAMPAPRDAVRSNCLLGAKGAAAVALNVRTTMRILEVLLELAIHEDGRTASAVTYQR